MGRKQQGILAGCGSKVLQGSLPSTYRNRLGLQTLTATRWMADDQR
jgi:hypothetical protein